MTVQHWAVPAVSGVAGHSTRMFVAIQLFLASNQALVINEAVAELVGAAHCLAEVVTATFPLLADLLAYELLLLVE